MDQRVRDRRWCSEAELRSLDSRAGDDRTADRRRGDRRARPPPAALPPTRCLSIGDRVRAGQPLGRLEPGSRHGDDRATLDGGPRRGAAALEAARAEQTRAERLLAERAVPARRVEDARRASTVAEARLQAAEARLAQRDETLRTRWRRAAGQRVRAARADRRSRRRGVGHARRLVRRGRAALPDRPDRSRRAAGAGAGRRRRRRRAGVDGASHSRFPASPSRSRSTPHHVHDSGVIDPHDPRAAAADRGRESGRAPAGRPDRARRFSTRESARSGCRPCRTTAVLMEAGRPYVFVQIGGERFARRFVEIAARDGDLVGVQSGVKPASASSRAARTTCSWRRPPKGLPAEGHVH